MPFALYAFQRPIGSFYAVRHPLSPFDGILSNQPRDYEISDTGDEYYYHSHKEFQFQNTSQDKEHRQNSPERDMNYRCPDFTDRNILLLFASFR